MWLSIPFPFFFLKPMHIVKHIVPFLGVFIFQCEPALLHICNHLCVHEKNLKLSSSLAHGSLTAKYLRQQPGDMSLYHNLHEKLQIRKKNWFHFSVFGTFFFFSFLWSYLEVPAPTIESFVGGFFIRAISSETYYYIMKAWQIA